MSNTNEMTKFVKFTSCFKNAEPVWLDPTMVESVCSTANGNTAIRMVSRWQWHVREPAAEVAKVIDEMC